MNTERQEFKPGDAQGTPSKYLMEAQTSKLGYVPEVIPYLFINNYRYTPVFILFT